jgi:hypothetical protein
MIPSAVAVVITESATTAGTPRKYEVWDMSKKGKLTDDPDILIEN